MVQSAETVRVAQAPTLQASLDLQATITDVTSKNRHVSARTLLQCEGSEGIVNRESVITNMEVPDADAVKAANSAFSPGEEVLLNDDWTDLEPDRVQRGPGGPPSEDDEQKDRVQGLRDDVARGLDDGCSQGSRTVPVDTALVCSTPE